MDVPLSVVVEDCVISTTVPMAVPPAAAHSFVLPYQPQPTISMIAPSTIKNGPTTKPAKGLLKPRRRIPPLRKFDLFLFMRFSLFVKSGFTYRHRKQPVCIQATTCFSLIVTSTFLLWVDRATFYGLVRMYMIGSTVMSGTGGHIVRVSPSQV